MTEDNENFAEDENAAAAEAENSAENTENNAGVISDISQVQPLGVVDFYRMSLESLHRDALYSEGHRLYMGGLYKKHFGENYTEADFNAGLEDVRQQAVVTDYIQDELDLIKMQSASLDYMKINKSFAGMFALVGLNVNIPNSVEDMYDKVFEARIGENAFLLDDYEVLKINREVWHIYSEKGNIPDLSSLVTEMEDLSVSLDDDKDSSAHKIVNKELLAQFYYNVSEIYEGVANGRNNLQDMNKWHFRAIEYKKKALDLTSANVVMVENIKNDWNGSSDYDPYKVAAACERIVDNDSVSERDIFRAHKLYADALLSVRKIEGFSDEKKQRTDLAVKHYRAALSHTVHDDDKIEILNKISKAQKPMYPEDYISTRLEIAALRTGRARIREYLKLSEFTHNKEFKAALLKTSINEFRELSQIKDEDRMLYDEADKRLRAEMPADDKKTIQLLNRLKKKYGMPDKKAPATMLLTMSSKGHDYFAK